MSAVMEERFLHPGIERHEGGMARLGWRRLGQRTTRSIERHEKRRGVLGNGDDGDVHRRIEQGKATSWVSGGWLISRRPNDVEQCLVPGKNDRPRNGGACACGEAVVCCALA